MSEFNEVSEVKAQIANAVLTYSVGSSEANSRLMYAHYTYSEAESTNYAVINAADLTGSSTTSDLTTTTDFEVVGIAQLAGVAEGSLGTFGGGVGGFNLTATKPAGLGGR